MTKLEKQLSFEESLKEGYKRGKWYSKNNLYCYGFNPSGAVIQIEIDNDANFEVKYFPENDKVGLNNRLPTSEYFQRLGYIIEPDVHVGGFEKMMKCFGVRFFWDRGMYIEGLAEHFGKQDRTITLLKKILRKNELSKEIIEQEKKELNQMVWNLYRAASAGL